MRCIITIILTCSFPILLFSQVKTAVEQYHVVGANRRYLPMSIAHIQTGNNWYAEGRYNYEELRTFSLYLGKTFSGNDALSYDVTPLLGGAIGNFNGVSTGLNVDLDYRKFFISLQTQYSFSTDQRLDNFFYNWSELGYQPLKWLYGGVSVQHTRLYNTEAVLEPGILLGCTFSKFSIPVYSFSPFNKNRYFMLGLTVEWGR